MTSEPNNESLEEPEFQRTRSEEYSGWNLVLQEQLLICVGDVTRQITMVQHPTLFFFNCSEVLNQSVLDTNFIITD
jgi:hypothetical protein